MDGYTLVTRGGVGEFRRDGLLLAVVDEGVALPRQLGYAGLDGELGLGGSEVVVATGLGCDGDGGIARVLVVGVRDGVLVGRDLLAALSDGDGRLMVRAVVVVLGGGEGDGQVARGRDD